jgi:outer membrane protein OmpA-like peptidoglycan-associated protein
MKNLKINLIGLLFLATITSFAQDEIPQLTSKDSIIQNSWRLGLGYNIVDDSGDVFGSLVDINEQWNTTVFPNRLSIGRNFKSGIGLEAIGSYNKYKAGNNIDGIFIQEDIDYFSADARITYDLNHLVGGKGWFDPYIGAGFGYTDANNVGRTTYNATVGFRTWLSDNWGLDVNSSGKWRTADKGTNHIQHAAGVVYQFGVEKGLSKKGLEKRNMIEEMVAERQRIADSIQAAENVKEAAVLAARLEKEKQEAARLAADEKAKRDAEAKRKSDLRGQIDALGHVYFGLNSSYLNTSSKKVLDSLGTIILNNPNLKLMVTSHTDSRGASKYNQWLSERRVVRTVEYLISKGIDKNRLSTKAFGEENLLNDCDDYKYCTEKEHRINRRSEFTITDY